MFPVLRQTGSVEEGVGVEWEPGDAVDRGEDPVHLDSLAHHHALALIIRCCSCCC